MASNVADSPFFQQQKAKGNIIVHGNSSNPREERFC